MSLLTPRVRGFQNLMEGSKGGQLSSYQGKDFLTLCLLLPPKTLRICILGLCFSNSWPVLGPQFRGKGFVWSWRWEKKIQNVKEGSVTEFSGLGISQDHPSENLPIKRRELWFKRKTTSSSQNCSTELRGSPPKIILRGQYFPLIKGHSNYRPIFLMIVDAKILNRT